MNRDMRYRHHSRTVSLWIDQRPADDTAEDLIEDFQRLLNRIVNSVSVPIGKPTVIAILDRVLYNGAGQYPLLLKITLDENFLDVVEMLKMPYKDMDEFKNAFHYLTTELLFTIGNLTAEAVTPALHAIFDLKKDSK